MSDRFYDLIITLKESLAKQGQEISNLQEHQKKIYLQVEQMKKNHEDCPAKKLAQQRAGVIQTVKDVTVIITVIILLLQLLDLIPKK
jgi:seryl-tRNA synthetase